MISGRNFERFSRQEIVVSISCAQLSARSLHSFSTNGIKNKLVASKSTKERLFTAANGRLRRLYQPRAAEVARSGKFKEVVLVQKTVSWLGWRKVVVRNSSEEEEERTFSFPSTEYDGVVGKVESLNTIFGEGMAVKRLLKNAFYKATGAGVRKSLLALARSDRTSNFARGNGPIGTHVEKRLGSFTLTTLRQNGLGVADMQVRQQVHHSELRGEGKKLRESRHTFKQRIQAVLGSQRSGDLKASLAGVVNSKTYFRRWGLYVQRRRALAWIKSRNSGEPRPQRDLIEAEAEEAAGLTGWGASGLKGVWKERGLFALVQRAFGQGRETYLNDIEEYETSDVKSEYSLFRTRARSFHPNAATEIALSLNFFRDQGLLSMKLQGLPVHLQTALGTVKAYEVLNVVYLAHRTLEQCLAKLLLDYRGFSESRARTGF